MRHFPLRAVFSPPSILEQLVQEPEALEQAKHLDFVMYAGGALSDTAGNLLSQMADVCQFYGQTETGPAQALVPLREDWAYSEWHPLYGAHMEPSEDDAYEMVLYRDPGLQGIRSVSCNFPDVEKWHTKDLFRPHPTKPNLWQFHGRTDDIIVLSNGEKFNPVPGETIIAAHPNLSGALIVGQGRFQAALLVEPQRQVQPETLIEDIWPIVEYANSQAPGHARITKSMIGVASSDKSFERAGKGTVIRKSTAEKFAPEIRSLYSDESLRKCPNGPILTSKENTQDVQDYVRACINLSFPVSRTQDDEDLYVLGLDSLKTLEIATVLKAGLGASDTSWLSSQMVYSNPSINKLSKAIGNRLDPHITSSREPKEAKVPREMVMAQLVQRFTQDLPQISTTHDKAPRPTELNVLLTGSTGSLGTYLLKALLDDPNIPKVYCLNRSADAQQKQIEQFARLKLDHDLNTQRVDFIKADYSQTQFGLSDAKFNELGTIVDVIIHNAWKVDFNHSLESFAPTHLRGIRTLVDWSISSKRHPRICFISSISSIGRWTTIQGSEGLIPETPIDSHGIAEKMGYAESKNVAERILGVAKEKSQVPVSILRIGQIAGPLSTTGVWNRDEWVPSMIKTSKSLECLPNYIPDMNWIPVDKLASIIIEIARFAVINDTAWTYNIVNTTPVPWASLLDIVRKRLGWQTKIVDLNEWIRMLERLDRNNTDEVQMHPALKILEFYRGLDSAKVRDGGHQKYCTEHGIAASETMARLEPVCPAWMENWLDQWGY